MRRLLALVALTTGLASGAVARTSHAEGWRPPGDRQTLPALPLRVVFTEVHDAPVRDEAWFGKQLAEARRLFADAGICFDRARTGYLGPEFANVEGRAGVQRFDAERDPGFINVFVVASIEGLPLWNHTGEAWGVTHTTRFVLLSARADSTAVLAHELGHYFGLSHSERSGDPMKPNGPPPVRFDELELLQIRHTAFGQLGQGALTPRPRVESECPAPSPEIVFDYR